MEDQTIQENCKLLLLKFPELRNPILKKQRIWKYWQEFEEVNIGITQKQFINLIDGESISRAFRKIQQENPNLRAEIKLQLENAKLVEIHRKSYASKQWKPSDPKERKQYDYMFNS